MQRGILSIFLFYPYLKSIVNWEAYTNKNLKKN